MRIDMALVQDRRGGLDDRDFVPLTCMRLGELIESRMDEYPTEFAYSEALRVTKARAKILPQRYADYVGRKFNVLKGKDRFWILRTS